MKKEREKKKLRAFSSSSFFSHHFPFFLHPSQKIKKDSIDNLNNNLSFSFLLLLDFEKE